MRRSFYAALAVLAIGGGAIFAAFRHDLSAAQDRLAGRSEIMPTSHGRLEYAVAGTGPAVLAIHGAAGGFDQALDMTGALTTRGYQVIAPSRFGYLRSDLPTALTTEMQADAYVGLLDRLGVEKAAVVSISAGAWSALQFAARHPDRCRAIILLVPADFLPEGTKIRGGPLADAMFKSDFVAWALLKATPVAPGALSEMMLGTDAAVVRSASAQEQARVQQVLDHLLPIRARSAGMRFDIETAAGRRAYPIGEVDCPLLAISAEDDRFGTAARAREIARLAPDGRALVFSTGGHALAGRFDETLNAITAFLGTTSP